MSSSQLTNSYFSEVWLNHQPVKITAFFLLIPMPQAAITSVYLGTRMPGVEPQQPMAASNGGFSILRNILTFIYIYVYIYIYTSYIIHHTWGNDGNGYYTFDFAMMYVKLLRMDITVSVPKKIERFNVLQFLLECTFLSFWVLLQL